MPQKRNEVSEEFEAGQLLPDVYENWLKKQQAGKAKAKTGFISGEATELDKEEDGIDLAEDAHEKAKRRKKGRTGR
jgi:hypothetical protein